MMNKLSRTLFLTAVISCMELACCEHGLADVFNMPSGHTNLQFVPIGNPGNPGDPQEYEGSIDLYGSVARHFQMGKYEVTSAQYVQFLNSVAKTDTFGLYNPDMW